MKILTLTTKDWLSGISQGGAFSDEGGLFYKADGITALFEASGSQSKYNGLLMSGGGGTVIGAPAGNITKIVPYNLSDDSIVMCDDLNIYRYSFPISAGNFANIHTTTNTILDLTSFKTSAGVEYLLYLQQNQIGTYDGTNWTDAWQSNNSALYGVMYNYFDMVLLSNGSGSISKIDDTLTYTQNALDIPNNQVCTSISDDGTYAVLATTTNVNTGDISLIQTTKILFWDGWSSSWLREYTLSDPVIYALHKTPFGLFAFGTTGIWQVSFGGVKKIFSHSPGITVSSTINTPIIVAGNVSYYSNSLMWGGASGSNYVVKSLGKLDTSYPSSYSHPLLSTSGKSITSLTGQVYKGYVLVADSTPQVTAYPLDSTAVSKTGTSAQTIYFKLPQKMMLKEIMLTFGEPLVPGDTFDVSTKLDESTTAVSFGTASYSATKANRRFTLRATKGVIVEDQISFILTFTAGAPKLKTMNVYAEPML